MKNKPRPICPECGSVDVVVGNKTGSCNRCGETFRAEAARSYPKGSGETRSSIEDRQLQVDDDVCSDQFRRSAHR